MRCGPPGQRTRQDESLVTASWVPYVISPTSHTEEFREKAPDLAAILGSTALATTARLYESEDQDALAAQKSFKRTFNRANAAVLGTGVLIALVLVTGTVAACLPDSLNRILLVIFGLGGVIARGFASRDLLVIRQGHLSETWMSRRAFAETQRLQYFETVAKSPVSSTTASSACGELVKLEYFRRFQLDVQLAFYRERAKNHRDEAAKTLSYSSCAAAGATIATGSAGMLGAAFGSRFAVIGAFAAVFTGLSSFASMREAVNQNRRNAERYERTYRVLEDLNKRLDKVREAVYTRGTEPLKDFVDAVHEQLALEHRQWLGQLSEAQGAFARLENTLREISSEILPKPGSASGDPGTS